MIWLTFGMNPLKTKWLPQPLKQIDMVVVGVIFFSLFIDIDGQSLRLRGPAINWWLFCLSKQLLPVCLFGFAEQYHEAYGDDTD